MKKISNIAVPAFSLAAIVLSVVAISSNAANPSQPSSTDSQNVQMVRSVAVSNAAQPVDLTYAAEKALPSVVHIKYVQNSKIQTVEVQSDPF